MSKIYENKSLGSAWKSALCFQIYAILALLFYLQIHAILEFQGHLQHIPFYIVHTHPSIKSWFFYEKNKADSSAGKIQR